MAENDGSFQTVTADDVAAHAGVSRWTVARAFKRDASISLKSRQKVLEVAERLGYVPDLLASSLASDRSNLVALILDDFENPHKLVMLERLTRVLRREGIGVLLVNLLDDGDASDALLVASQRRVDATIVIGTRFDHRVLDVALGARRVKKLLIFARSSQTANTISVSCDDELAMGEIAAHLFTRGRRRPLFVAGPDSQSATLRRKASFLTHWNRLAGYTPPAIHVARYDTTAAIAGVSEILANRSTAELPDALVCESDIIAIGAMDTLRYRFQMSVPEDMSVTGFDDIPLASSPAYQLTTYRQPITAMAEALARILVGDAHDSVLLAGRFIPRTSG